MPDDDASAAAAAQGPPRAPAAGSPPRGGLLFDSPEDRALADRQKAAIRYVASRLGSQLLSGSVSFRATSMPVHLNEPRSFLQRLTDDLIYARHLLDSAAAETDPARRLLYVGGYVVSGLLPVASMAKVFNPQIGETFHATFGPADDATDVFLEQTRHHPPVSHFVATPTSKAYTLSGYSSFDSSFRVSESALYTRRTGITVIDFGCDPTDRIVFTYPTGVIRGILTGDRRFDVQGTCSVFYERHGLVLDLVFDPHGIASSHATVAAVTSLIPSIFGTFSSDSSDTVEPHDRCADAVRGVLYRLDSDSLTAFTGAFAEAKHAGFCFFGDPDSVCGRGTTAENGSIASRDCAAVELRSEKDVQQSVATAWGADISMMDVEPDHGLEASPAKLQRKIIALASGSWLSHFDAAGEHFWDLASPRHNVVPVPLERCLPSDSRHRDDLIALRRVLEGGNGTMNENAAQGREAGLDKVQVIKEKLEEEVRSDSRLRPVPELSTDPFFPTSIPGIPPK